VIVLGHATHCPRFAFSAELARKLASPFRGRCSRCLSVDFVPAESNLLDPVMLLNRLRRKLFGEYAFLDNYKDHPDERQTQLFFGYLKECLDTGLVTEDLVKQHMAANHVRHDAFEVIQRTPPIEQVLAKAA
jgi:hypothetical protein